MEYLSLSKNRLGEKAGLLLGPAIAENGSIRQLDLSFNGLRGKGAAAVAKGLQVVKARELFSALNPLHQW